MRFVERVCKPAYIYRPDQLMRRVAVRRGRDEETGLVLPWGLPIVVSSSDVLGSGLIRRNVHEMAVTEVMWRLTGADDLTVDVGANSGYFTALLAFRAREVIAFEPHPALHARLRTTVDAWPAACRVKVALHAHAISDSGGVMPLSIPAGFAGNEGLATLCLPAGRAHETIEVRTVTLDDVLGGRRVGMLKLDIEGHERAALEGARQALDAGRVRDVLFEEHDPLPTPVSRLLAECGYRLFGLHERLRGVQLTPAFAPSSGWDAAMYLATLDPARAQARVRRDGWNCLRPR